MRRIAERVASSTLEGYIACANQTLHWTSAMLRGVVLHLGRSVVFCACFVACLVAEYLRRWRRGPNLVAAVERFIDTHVHFHRFAIHQIVLLSWLLTGSCR